MFSTAKSSQDVDMAPKEDHHEVFLQKLQENLAALQKTLAAVNEGKEAYKGQLEQQKNALLQQQKALEEKRLQFEKEKDALMDPNARDTDIIELNVGGRLIATSRATLCADPDTLLAAMFSGRWEKQLPRDRNGAAFLDFDPTLFELLLNHLRTTQLTVPGGLPSASAAAGGAGAAGAQKGKGLPQPPADKKEVWKAMVTHLGFIKPPVPGLPGPTTDVALLSTFSKQFTHSHVTLSEGNKVATLQRGISGWGFLALNGAIGKETHTWKLKASNTDSDYATKIRIGFINEAEVERLKDKSNHNGFASIGTWIEIDGDDTVVKKDGNTKDRLSFSRNLSRDAEFEFSVDARNPEEMKMTLPGLCSDEIAFEINKKGGEEWEKMRLLIGVYYTPQRIEIVSVDA